MVLITQEVQRERNLANSNYGHNKFLQECMDGMGMEAQSMCGTEKCRLGLLMFQHIWLGMKEREKELSDV